MHSKERKEIEEKIDPITLESIPEEMCIQVRDMYFDISTLYMSYAKTKKMENPYTREQLSCDIVRKVRSYGESKKIQVHYISNYHMIDPFVTLGELILLLEKSDVLACRNIDLWDKSIYDEDLDTPIEKYEKNGELKLYFNGSMTIDKIRTLIAFAQKQSNTERLIALLQMKIDLMSRKGKPKIRKFRYIYLNGFPARLFLEDGEMEFEMIRDTAEIPENAYQVDPHQHFETTDRSPEYILDLVRKYPNTRHINERDFYRDELLYTKEPENILLSAYNEIRDPVILQETLLKCIWFNKKLVVYPDFFQQISTIQTYGNKKIKKNLITLLKKCVDSYGWPMKRNNGTIIDRNRIPPYILNNIRI